MTEHYATVTVKAPVEQVYALFTHFEDFPKFMSFVREVTLYDGQRSHWVVNVLGEYEWDAINEDWVPDQQVGWRSVSGLKNAGKVKFRALGPERTIVDVYISYVPPSGAIGYLGDSLGGSEYFSRILHQDLANFARLVEEAPPGALDPMSSHYILHSASAVAKGQITRRQKARLANDPNMAKEILAERLAYLQAEQARKLQEQQELEASLMKKREEEERLRLELEALMAQEQERRMLEQRERKAALAQELALQMPPDPLQDTLGGRGASMARTASGDRDGKRARHPGYERDPMTARYPLKPGAKPTRKLLDEEMEKYESPWFRSIRGAPLPPPSVE